MLAVKGPEGIAGHSPKSWDNCRRSNPSTAEAVPFQLRFFPQPLKTNA